MSVQDIRKTEANPNFVAFVEGMLEDAKSGEIQGMCGVLIYENSHVSDFWCNPPKVYHTKITSRRVIGELECMKLEFMTAGKWVKHNELM